MIIAKLLDRMFSRMLKVGRESVCTWNIRGKAGMSKIHTYFGFKRGKLVSVLQSVNGDVKDAANCTYYIAEPQEVEKQIERWKKETSK